MLNQESSSHLPICEPHKLLGLINDYLAFRDDYRRRFSNRIGSGWQYEEVPVLAGNYFDVELRTIEIGLPLGSYHYSQRSDDEFRNLEADTSIDNITTTSGSLEHWLSLHGTFDHFLTESNGFTYQFGGEAAITDFHYLAWKMMQFRIGEVVFGCFHYSPKPQHHQ